MLTTTGIFNSILIPLEQGLRPTNNITIVALVAFYPHSIRTRIESLGTRMNFSVFECMLTDIQYTSMCKHLAKIVVRREDWVNIYPLCTECYARIEYIPPVKKKEPVKIAVV